ncbi:hypothetical protein K0M31_004528 [Melipona bicolor]|uniref:Uncharacterized protein n=1 Tax=Melipona bicolor TaxID=60889 RepID=A0AA40KNN8_9HYME|nr:hypothetical protein K0M31_004528 [Melipona bicolor]
MQISPSKTSSTVLSPDLYELRLSEYRELFFPFALPRSTIRRSLKQQEAKVEDQAKTVQQPPPSPTYVPSSYVYVYVKLDVKNSNVSGH